ncbi:MAG: phosphoenolpyruvate carboxylase, partial [Pseudomonadota bacterium]
MFAYAQDLFRALESGALTLEDLEQTSQSVYGNLIIERAAQFRRQHQVTKDLDQRLSALANQGWDAFQTLVERPLGGVVFTGHPTFALSPNIRAAFAEHVSENTETSGDALRKSITADGRAWSKSISLLGEHAEAQATITHAQDALTAYATRVLDIARRTFPDTWRTLKLSLPTIASWVGYDLDGRTDIHWSQSFALRLQEKAVQLSRYVVDLTALQDRATGDTQATLSGLIEQLDAAAVLTQAEAEVFSEDLTLPDNLVQAANLLTAAQTDRIIHAQPIIETLRALAASE